MDSVEQQAIHRSAFGTCQLNRLSGTCGVNAVKTGGRFGVLLACEKSRSPWRWCLSKLGQKVPCQVHGLKGDIPC